MARNSYSGEKRRKERERKKKREQKLRVRAERARQAADGQQEGNSSGDAVEEAAYLEYLNPGGPRDPRFEAEEEDSEEE